MKHLKQLGEILSKTEQKLINGGSKGPITGPCPPLPPEEICCTLTNGFGCCVEWYIRPYPGGCEG